MLNLKLQFEGRLWPTSHFWLRVSYISCSVNIICDSCVVAYFCETGVELGLYSCAIEWLSVVNWLYSLVAGCIVTCFVRETCKGGKGGKGGREAAIYYHSLAPS